MISVPLPQLNAALIEPPFPHAFTVLGYQTAEEARAYFAGQTKPFAKIEEWLEDNLPGARSVSAHDDFHGSATVKSDRWRTVKMEITAAVKMSYQTQSRSPRLHHPASRWRASQGKPG